MLDDRLVTRLENHDKAQVMTTALVEYFKLDRDTLLAKGEKPLAPDKPKIPFVMPPRQILRMLPNGQVVDVTDELTSSVKHESSAVTDKFEYLPEPIEPDDSDWREN